MRISTKLQVRSFYCAPVTRGIGGRTSTTRSASATGSVPAALLATHGYVIHANVSLHMTFRTCGGGGKCGLRSGWDKTQRNGHFMAMSHTGDKVRGEITTGTGRKIVPHRTLFSLCLSPQAAVVGFGNLMDVALNFAIVCLLTLPMCCEYVR